MPPQVEHYAWRAMQRWTHHSWSAGPGPTRVEPLIRNWGLRPRILRRAGNENNDQLVCKCLGIAQISQRLLRWSCVPGSRRFGNYAHGNGPTPPPLPSEPSTKKLHRNDITAGLIRGGVADKFLTKTPLVLLVAHSFCSQVDTTQPLV